MQLFSFFGRYTLRALFCLLAMLQAPALQAQPQGADQCGQLVEAYKAGPAAYGPYLQIADGVAVARDGQEGSNRYTQALRASAASANALWLNNWCTQNPLKRVAEASNNLLSELTGQAHAPMAAQPAPATSPAVIVVQPPARPKPMASCSVAKTKSCGGCSVTCTKDWQKASCKAGTDSIPGGEQCTFKAECSCW